MKHRRQRSEGAGDPGTLGDFDLLFTDVIMPDGMTGRQLTDRVRALKPRLKILYTSAIRKTRLSTKGGLTLISTF